MKFFIRLEAKTRWKNSESCCFKSATRCDFRCFHAAVTFLMKTAAKRRKRENA